MSENHICNEKFTSILNNMFYGLMLVSDDGIVLEFNNSSLKLLEKKMHEVENVKVSSLVPDIYKEDFEVYFENCLNQETKNYGKFEVSITLDDGNVRVLEIDCNQNYVSEEDYKKATICIINDITDKKELEKELENQKKNILNKIEGKQELSDMKSRFITIASHEFRTPLSGILSSIDLIDRYLKSDTDFLNSFEHSSKVSSHIEKVNSSIHTLSATLNQFLSLGKFDEGQVVYKEELFGFRLFVEQIIDGFNKRLKKGQDIIFNCEFCNVEILLDKSIFRYVLENLLVNAIKYSPENANIFIDVVIADEEISLKVKDEGIGIPKQEQKNIFRRFYRATNATNIQGTGLGLTIVKKYVALIDGTITFVSEEDKGTEFTVLIPRPDKIQK